MFVFGKITEVSLYKCMPASPSVGFNNGFKKGFRMIKLVLLVPGRFVRKQTHMPNLYDQLA